MFEAGEGELEDDEGGGELSRSSHCGSKSSLSLDGTGTVTYVPCERFLL